MKSLLKISDTIEGSAAGRSYCLFAVMTITYSTQIFLRYVVGTGVKWTEELTRYAYLGHHDRFAMIAKRRKHINVSVLEEVSEQVIGRGSLWYSRLFPLSYSRRCSSSRSD